MRKFGYLFNQQLNQMFISPSTYIAAFLFLAFMGVLYLYSLVDVSRGSGGTNRTNVGGPASSFGIWKDYIPQIMETAARHGLKIVRIHTHIGSGSDPLVWQKVAEMSLGVTFRPARSIMRIRGVLLTPMPMTATDLPRRDSKYSAMVDINVLLPCFSL